MLVGSLVDFRKEIAKKIEWNPSSLIRQYADAQFSEFKQDQFQYQKTYKPFNGRTPSNYFNLAEEDAYKYVEAPKDPNDWRNFIRTGEERNKLDGLLSFLLDLNFRCEPEVRDWAGEINPKAADIAEAYLRFLNVLGDSETKDPLLDFCMFMHGTVIGQVKLDVKKQLQKTIAEWKPEEKIENYDPTLTEVDGITRVGLHVLKPNRVYFADVSRLSMEEQDHVWYEAVVPYSRAYQMFHTWSQWQHVKPFNATADAWTDTDVDVETESKEQPDKVRIKWRESEVTNELSIYCNKVLMTPPCLKLPEGCYSIFYQQASVLHPFMCYGRSFMDNVRPFAAVKDVLTSILVDKSRQILEPPMKSRFRTMVNRYMYKPGSVTPMQGEGDLTPLIPESAMQSFVFETIKVYDDMINKASISPVFQGQQTKGQMTKYEVEQTLIQSIRAVAGMVGAAAARRRQQAKLQLKIGLNHLEDITNFHFEAQGDLNEIARVVDLKEIPEDKKTRYEALNTLMKAEARYRKNGNRRQFYIASPKKLKEANYVINYRVNPQQRDSKSGNEQNIKEKVALYRTAPNANQRSVDKLLVKMFNDEEDEMLMPEQQGMPQGMPQGAAGASGVPPELAPQIGMQPDAALQEALKSPQLEPQV